MALGLVRACPDPTLLQGDTYGLREEIPVSGRLSYFLPFWEKITSDQWVLEVVKHGYRLNLEGSPPFTGCHRTRLRDGQAALSEEVASLLDKSAVEKVPPDQERTGFYSTYFLVPKKDGGIRPILNLKRFNQYLTVPKFKMETLQSIIPLLSQGLWLASVDLKDAYFHIPIAKEHRKYLRFLFEGQAYQYKVAPFGLSPAPMLFTRVLLAIIAWLRLQGVHIHVYLDDLLIAGQSPQQVHLAIRLVLATLTHAGYVINTKKSDLSPTQDLVYIGGRFRTDLGRVFLPEDRRQLLCKVVRSFMRVGQYLPARQWLQLLGLMAAAIPTVEFAHLQMRRIQWYLKGKWQARKHDLDMKIMVPGSLLQCFQWWLATENLSRGRPFQEPKHTAVVTTDASKDGWGGHSCLGGSDVLFSGLWSRLESRNHINLLELQAVFLTLKNLQSKLEGQVVRLECDNTTAVAYINHQGGTRSQPLNKLAMELYEWAVKHRVTMQAVHRPGVDNVLADYLSRTRPDPTEWSLHPKVCQSLFQMWGRPQIDLFASPQNHKLPLWFSRHPCPQATAVNAMAQTWTGWRVYAFPPFNMIQETLLKVREEEVEEVIMVAPCWPYRPWFPLLLQLAVDKPVLLSHRIDLLSQKLEGAGTLYHQDLATLHLAAWRLSAAPGARRAIPTLSQILQGQRGEIAPGQITIQNGSITVTGAKTKASVRLGRL